MTPQDLIARLDTANAEAALIFVTEKGPIGAGYHVTEVKLASVESLDCVARRSRWTEAQIQLLDGNGQDYMTVGKFTGILRKAITELEGLGDTQLKFEFSNGNKGLHILEPGDPVATEGTVSLPLGDINAACKPAVDAALMQGAVSRCGASSHAGRTCC